MRSSPLALVAVVLACTSFACGGGDDDDDDGGDDGDTPQIDAGIVSDPDDETETTEWKFGPVFGVPDLDDDDGAQVDFDQTPFAADDDRSILVLPASAIGTLPSDQSIELSLSGALADVKVWQGDTLLVGGGAGAGPATVAIGAADTQLTIVFGDYNRSATLTVARVDGVGTVLQSADVALRSSPLIMNHHLQPAEHVWAMAVNGNQSMIAAYESALGDRFSRVSSSFYGGDVWVQDEIEFATATGAAGQRLDIVIDSIRDRGLDDFPEDELVGPGVIAQTWGDHFDRSSYDSFGNLDASPPVTVGGVEYPFGRIYYGQTDFEGMDSVLPDFLISQEVQAPFRLDTSWLCVGHVDEFSSFVADPSSPKGFKLLLADTRVAWEIIEGMSPSADLGRFGPDHGYATAGDMLDDADLVALNDELQIDKLDAIRDRFKDELGLTDDDIIMVPSLFEVVPGCGGGVVALIPGMANLIVANVEGQPTKLFVPDPFFRAVGASVTTDPMRAAFASSMPAGNEVVFVDDWNVYHLGLGEVHCGTNVTRTPLRAWWDAFSGGE